MKYITTPISHLFKNKKYEKKIIEHSHCLETRPDSINSSLNGQNLFHCDIIQPIHVMKEREFEFLKKIKKLKPKLELISFHCASICENPKIKNGIWISGEKYYTRVELMANAKNNFLEIKKIFGENIEIAIENNNYYPTDVYDIVTEPEFIFSIVNENNIKFLFDIAHSQITCHNKGLKYKDYIEKLPLNQLIQIHICHFGINENNLAMDFHTCPNKNTFNKVKDLIKNWNSKFFTIEYYKELNGLIQALKTLRNLIK